MFFGVGDDAPEAVFTNWQRGEPNNHGGREDCVMMYHNGNWNDGNCAIRLPFVCSLKSKKKPPAVKRVIPQGSIKKNMAKKIVCYESRYNGWDRVQNFSCRHNYVMVGVKSHHNNRFEDRRFKWKCCSFPGITTHRRSGLSRFSGWDRLQHFSCPSGQALSTVYSAHNNHREDRRWKFGCSVVRGHALRRCKWYKNVNYWDRPVNFNCPRGWMMTAQRSYHHNGREDRRFSFRCCATRISIVGGSLQGAWNRIATPWVSSLSHYAGYVYGVGRDKRIYRVKQTGGRWHKLARSCCVLQIWVGRQFGRVFIWGIGTNHAVYKRAIGGRWRRLASPYLWVSQIQVHRNFLYGIGRNRRIYRTGLNGGRWRRIPNSCCVTNMVLNDGFIYGIGTNKALYKRPIFGHRARWRKIAPYSVTQIQIYKNYVLGLGTNKRVYFTHKGRMNFRRWKLLGRSCCVKHITVGGGKLFGIGTRHALWRKRSLRLATLGDSALAQQQQQQQQNEGEYTMEEDLESENFNMKSNYLMAGIMAVGGIGGVFFVVRIFRHRNWINNSQYETVE